MVVLLQVLGYYFSEGYALNPEMIMLIEYENLCKEPEKTMREVYEFLEKTLLFS
jgi:hypothetical protein